MKIFASQEIKRIDEYTIENEPIESIDLMERAAASITYEIMSRWKRNVPLVVFAGPGNNGGDALAVARMLAEEGYKPRVFLFCPKNQIAPNCQINRDRLVETDGADLTEVISMFTPPDLNCQTVFVDGLFGSGLREPLAGGYASIVQFVNASDAQVVSIDLPSGMLSEDNRETNRRNIIRAKYTFSFQFPKLAFMFPESEEFLGEWKVLDIGLHPQIITDMPSKYNFIEANDIKSFFVPRSRFADKNQMGHALLVAGSFGMTGAAVLCGRAALRAGAGLVTIHSAACAYPVLQATVPEALFLSDENEKFVSQVNIKRTYSTIAFGPGLGRNEETIKAIEKLCGNLRRPAIIDADALFAFSEKPDLLGRLPKQSIITPHIREFDRLFGKSDNSYSRLEKAIEQARKNNIIIVLKGAYTAIVFPLGEVYFNSTGNPGMATAGCGDVLTGIIAGLLAQGYAPRQAVILGVYLHGLAADLAIEKSAIQSLIAGDIIDYLGKAYHQISKV